MKVSLIGPVFPFRGGIVHYTIHLANALQSLGHSCEITSFRRQYPSWLYPGGSDKDPSQTEKHINAKYLIDPFFPWTWQWCGQHVRQQNPDLVVLQWWTTFWTVPFAYLTRWFNHNKIPIVYIVHNVLPHEEKKWDRWMAKFALSSADGFIVQTPGEKNRLLTLLPKAMIDISPHPVYSMFVNNRIDKMKARQALELPQKQSILLFFGIVRPYKGLKYLIDALTILKEGGKTPYLLVAGDFWEDISIYQKQIEMAGLSDQVKLDNRYIPDDDATLMFSAVDGVVAPYVGGTQSGVAGIAQGFGLPLIVTNHIASGLSEYNPEFVQVIPPADVHALAGAIDKLITSSLPDTDNQAGLQDNWWKMVQSLVDLHNKISKEPNCA